MFSCSHVLTHRGIDCSSFVVSIVAPPPNTYVPTSSINPSNGDAASGGTSSGDAPSGGTSTRGTVEEVDLSPMRSSESSALAAAPRYPHPPAPSSPYVQPKPPPPPPPTSMQTTSSPSSSSSGASGRHLVPSIPFY